MPDEETNPLSDEIPEEIQGLNLEQRLFLARKNCPDIPKKGYNSRHDYNFLRSADMTEIGERVLREHGLDHDGEMLGIDRTREDKSLVEWCMTISCPDTGEKRDYQWFSEGWDKQDKSIPKAITMAMKGFLRFVLKVPSNEEAEREDAAEAGDETRPSDSSESTPKPPEEDKHEFVVTNGLEIGEGGRDRLKDLGFQYDSESKTWTFKATEDQLQDYKDWLDEIGANYNILNPGDN